MKLSPEQKGRAVASLKKPAIYLAVGLAYYLFVRVTGWAIPCVFYLLSHKYCPGCGITRMCMALLRLDFSAAFTYNALVMTMLPVGLVLAIRRWWIYAQKGESEMDLPEKIALTVAFVLTMAFWVLRNLPQFAFLAPGV